MQRATRIGDVVFQANDDDALRDRYRKQRGIDVQPWGGAGFPRADAKGRPVADTTIWSIADASDVSFARGTPPFRANDRAAGLQALVTALRSEALQRAQPDRGVGVRPFRLGDRSGRRRRRAAGAVTGALARASRSGVSVTDPACIVGRQAASGEWP